MHRLINWRNITHSKELEDVRLHPLQNDFLDTQLLVIDEVSMLGRQFTAKIDKRCRQATAGRNYFDESIWELSCVGAGAPAQIEAISGQQVHDTK